jgi:hypothetical protein
MLFYLEWQTNLLAKPQNKAQEEPTRGEKQYREKAEGS